MKTTRAKTVATSNDKFDDFLQDTTLLIRDLWEQNGGKQLDYDTCCQLNDLLTQFLQEKRK